MEISILKKRDLKQYKDLMDECFDGSNDLSYYKDNYDENNDNYQIIVAIIDNKIVGSVTMYKMNLFTFSFQPAIEIFNVAVLKEYRGQKIGKQMLNYIIDYARNNGYKTIYLTCLDTAIDAHHLYESVGFKRANSLKYSLHIGENL